MKDAAKASIFSRLGRSAYRRRRIVIAVWAVLFAAFAPLAAKTPGLMKDNGFTPAGSESDRGLARLQNELGFPPSMLQLVYTSNRLDVTSDSAKASILQSLEPLRAMPDVEEPAIVTAPPAGGAKVTAVNVPLQLPTASALEAYPKLKEAIRAPAGMNVFVTGGTAVLYDMQEASKRDIRKAEAIGLPIALLVLLAVFGTLVGAVLPLVVGLMSVTLTLGITYFIARNVPLSDFLPNMVSMLGLAVGTDYALFMVSRFREELKRRESVEEAVARTMQTAGASIFFSGGAVLIGLLGMLFIPLAFFRSLCLGGALVVSVSVLAGVTLLPALLGLLGTRINALHVLPQRRRRDGGAFWTKVSALVMRRPIVLTAVICAALAALMQPLGHMKLGLPSAEVLPPSYESRYGSDLLKSSFDARELNPIQIVVRTPQSVWDEASLAALREYRKRLLAVPNVRSVKSVVEPLDRLPDAAAAGLELGGAERLKAERLALQRQLEKQRLAKDKTTVLFVVPATAPDEPETDQLVRALRGVRPDGLELLVTGSPAYRLDVLDRIQANTASVLVFVMSITYVVLLFAFRSVVLPLKAVVMNALSLGASMGVVVRVFQYGNGAGLLHITSTGYVSATLPVIIFCVVFGISMDYEVFLISRIAEEYAATGDNERSTAAGLQKTGSLITSAASILIVVVGSFLFTDIELMKALGLGLGLAVLIDAAVVRVALVPALMKLLGRANWWAPRWLKLGR
jgi:RND superfamily putative drug exporter